MGYFAKRYHGIMLRNSRIYLLILLLTGCATTPQESLNSNPVQSELSKFSQMITEQYDLDDSTNQHFQGWYPWALTPSKPKTKYQLMDHNGKMVIHADAKASASGLMINLKPRNISGSSLAWEWKALELVPGADNSVGHKDDAPLRIMLAFEGDKKKLSLKAVSYTHLTLPTIYSV